jgi:hypothetical protein
VPFPNQLFILRKFSYGILFTTVMFCIILLGAIVLNQFSSFIHHHNLLPEQFIVGVEVVEYIIYILDICCFLYAVALHTTEFVIEIWQVFRGKRMNEDA